MKSSLMKLRENILPVLLSILIIGILYSSPLLAFERRTPIVEAVQKAGPAIVNIYTQEAPHSVQNPFRNFGGKFFEPFLRDFMPQMESGRRSLGSGVLIHPDGYILTNEHVIGKAVRIQTSLVDKREFSARLVGSDIRSDLAIIKIDSKEPLPFLKMGESDDLMIGEPVIAIGNPFGLQHTVTSGIISALNRTLDTKKGQGEGSGKGAIYHDFIQVDASINPGNSGGPLLNINGSLIGINTAIYQRAEGIGFAIPINYAKRIVKELIQFGKVREGWLGASVQELTQEMREYFSLKPNQGTLISHIMKGSPADLKGLQSGDVILAVDGRKISNRLDYQERIATYAIGSQVGITLLRAGIEKKISLEIAPLPKDFVERFTQLKMGLKVTNITKEAFNRYRLASRKGILITEVAPNGAAGQMGLQPGDLIRQINQDNVSNLKQFSKAVIEGRNRSSMLLLVQRGRNGYYVTLEM